MVAGISTELGIQETFSIFFSSIFSVSGFLDVLRRTTPLLIAAIGLAVAFRTGFWNIGGEGQIVIGSLVGVGVSLFLDAPVFLKIFLAFFLSFLAGGAFAGVPGFMKAKWDVNDIVSTMMLNFVALALLTYLIVGPWHYGTLYPRTEPIPGGMQLPFISYPLSVTFFLALALAFVVYLLLKKTTIGYEMEMVGKNPTAAYTYGISTTKTTVLAAIISGGVCALAGTALVLGEFFRVQGGISGNYGFYAIAVALLARNKVEFLLFASLLVAIIITGMTSLSVSGMPSRFGEVVVGLIFIIVFLPGVLIKSKFLKGLLT